jgi:hypothetical protein
MSKRAAAEQEVLVDLGYEGGGHTLVRQRQPGEAWQLYERWSSMYLDDDDVDQVAGGTDPVSSLEHWLEGLGENLARVHPIEIHPEVCAQVWKAVCGVAPVGHTRGSGWRHVRESWGHFFPWSRAWSPATGQHLIFVVSPRPRLRSALREVLRAWDDEQPHGQHVVVALEAPEELLIVERELKRSADLIVLDLPPEQILDLQQLREAEESCAVFLAFVGSAREARRLDAQVFDTFIRPRAPTPAALASVRSCKSARSFYADRALLEAVEGAIYARG